MILRLFRPVLIVSVVLAAMSPACLCGQVLPWDVFADTESSSVCDLVNAGNAELVVLSSTGELVVVSGPDVILADTFVDLDGFVFFGFEPVGVITFAEDGDGFRTLWWLSLDGFVFDVDSFTGLVLETGSVPTDIINVPCDACPFWDDPTACLPVIFDEDLDGVEDIDDFCPNTPLDEFVDFDGCSCSQLDDDGDGIDDCFDLCPGTLWFDIADFDGCSCFQLDDDGDGVDNCDDLCPTTPFGAQVDHDGCLLSGSPPRVTVNLCGSAGMLLLALTFCGLMGLRRRR